MFGKKKEKLDRLSGTEQANKRKEIIARLKILIYKLETGVVFTEEISESILKNLKLACKNLENICIERSDSEMIALFYSSIISNIEILERQKTDDTHRSRLDTDLRVDNLITKANEILNATQKWKESK